MKSLYGTNILDFSLKYKFLLIILVVSCVDVIILWWKQPFKCLNVVVTKAAKFKRLNASLLNGFQWCLKNIKPIIHVYDKGSPLNFTHMKLGCSKL